MRQTVACTLAFALAIGQPAWAADEGNSWSKLRYRGGTVQAKVDPYDFNTTLTVTQDQIVLAFTRSVTVRIRPSQVDSLSYGQEAHRKVADVVALSVVFSPLALFGLLHVAKYHLIGIVYHTEDGKPAAVLLEAEKTNYAAILLALKTVTGKPVEKAP
jgi:hypothetical protein